MTVTGSVTAATSGIGVHRADGVRVVWKAKFWGKENNITSMFYVHPQTKKSSFEVAEGADIVGYGDRTVNVCGGGQCDILVSGGYIANKRENGVCIDIAEEAKGYSGYYPSVNQKVTVTGGTVTATAKNGKAIVTNGLSTVVNLKGGFITAGTDGSGARAIVLGSTTDKSEVHVSGGDVWASLEAIGSGIYLSGSATTGTVNVTGGKVGATGLRPVTAFAWTATGAWWISAAAAR